MPTDDMRIKIRVDGAEKSSKDLNGIQSSIGGMVKTALTATAVIYALKTAFDFSIVLKNFSRDAEETRNKFLTVFENISIAAENTADALANSFGIANTTAMSLLGATGDLLVGFGFTEEKALEMSDAVNRLAIDLASFQNYAGGAEGASQALTKAILGETESAKSLGIVIRQDTKEFKAQVEELQGLYGLTVQQAKAQLILEQAYTQSSKAVGDFGRTQDQLANQERILSEVTKEFKEMLGDKLQPVFLAATKGAIGFFRSLTETSLDTTIRQLEELGVASKDILEIKKFSWNIQLQDINTELKKAGVNYESIKDVTAEITKLREDEITLIKAKATLQTSEFTTLGQFQDFYADIGKSQEEINKLTQNYNSYLSNSETKEEAIKDLWGLVFGELLDSTMEVKNQSSELAKYSNILIEREALEAKINQTINNRPDGNDVQELSFKGIDLTNFLNDIDIINTETEKLAKETLLNLGVNIDTASIQELEETLKTLTDKQAIIDLIVKTNPEATEAEIKKESDRILELFSKVAPVVQAKIELADFDPQKEFEDFKLMFNLEIDENFKEQYVTMVDEIREEIDDEEIKIPLTLDTGLYEELLAEDEATRQEIMARWQDVGNVMQGIFSNGFRTSFDEIKENFKAMIEQMLFDLAVSGLLSLLSGNQSGGFGSFGSNGIFNGVFGGGSVTTKTATQAMPSIIIQNVIDPRQINEANIIGASSNGAF